MHSIREKASYQIPFCNFVLQKFSLGNIIHIDATILVWETKVVRVHVRLEKRLRE